MKRQALINSPHSVNLEQTYRPIQQLVPAHWTQTTVVANGIRQNYLRSGGDKPPVLLLHGFMECGVSWLRLARLLAERYDVIMPDARVHGHSAGSESGFSPEILTADVVALINTLKLERPILIGRSNGAITAFLVAAQHPTLVRALIMEDPPAGGRPAPAVRQDVLTGNNWFQEWMTWLRQLKSLGHAERVASTAARWPHGMPIPQDEPLWNEDDFVGYVESMASFDSSIFQQQIAYWTLVSHLDAIGKIACPILLLTGEPLLGSVMPEDVVLTLMERSPRLQWQQIAGGGHILSRGRPFTQYMVVVEAFLATV